MLGCDSMGDSSGFSQWVKIPICTHVGYLGIRPPTLNPSGDWCRSSKWPICSPIRSAILRPVATRSGGRGGFFGLFGKPKKLRNDGWLLENGEMMNELGMLRLVQENILFPEFVRYEILILASMLITFWVCDMLGSQHSRSPKHHGQRHSV